MLPSMPCLNISDISNHMTSNQHIQKVNDELLDKPENSELPEDRKDNIRIESLQDKTAQKLESNKSNVAVISSSNVLEVCNKDNVDEINALMVASSTIKNVREKKELFSVADKKKAKKRKEYLSSLAMLLPPDPSSEKEKNYQFAQSYLEKLKETLDETDFNKVMHIFENIDDESPVELYTEIKSILDSKYQDLSDEFLLFLNAEQANCIGKLIPFIIINHMAKFLRNLEVYFKDQPSQLRKIQKSLIEMHKTSNVTLEKLKSVILPLLRGNPLLCDGFLQIFLEETPPSILFNNTYENIDVNKEMNKAEEEQVFESIVVSDGDDSSCLCHCHKVDEQQPTKQHCINCGLRFLQGKVYCQTGRGLKSVNVTFPRDLDIDHNARLGVQNKLKRLDHVPNRPTHSPNKDGLYDHRSCKYIEDNDKRKNMKGCRSPKKNKTNAKKICVISKDKDFLMKSLKNSPKKLTGDLCKQNKRKRISFSEKSCSVLLNESDICSKQIESLVDVIGRQNLPPPEYLDIHSSDSDFSQDECADIIRKRNNTFGKKKSKWDMWSREEDKIILQTFQQKFSEDAFQLIANQLKNRSAHEIRSRFEILMMLLQEMENT